MDDLTGFCCTSSACQANFVTLLAVLHQLRNFNTSVVCHSAYFAASRLLGHVDLRWGVPHDTVSTRPILHDGDETGGHGPQDA